MPELTIAHLLVAAAVCETTGHIDTADALTEEAARRTTQQEQEGDHDGQDQSIG